MISTSRVSPITAAILPIPIAKHCANVTSRRCASPAFRSIVPIVDWLPRWDAHLLALVRRAFPGTRLVIVERDPRDALINWLAFGWARGFPCARSGRVSAWLGRAREHLHYADALDEPRRLVVAADALLDDPVANGGELARFLGLRTLEPGANLAAMAHGLGGLPVRFPRGHWQRYGEALAEPFASLGAR